MLSILAALVIGASTAHAAGLDVTVLDCPGDAGASRNANLDCAGGTSTTLLVGFAPAEAITDLVALDTIMDFWMPGGADASTTANFWDFATAHQTGITMNHLRPAGICADYANTWNAANAGTSWAAIISSPQNVRMAAGAYRPSNFVAAQDQKLFGFQLQFNTGGAVQNGGSLAGCPLAVGVSVEQGVPQSASGAPTTTLCNYCCSFHGECTPSVPPIQFTFNDPTVATVRRTWAQLKALYR